MFLCDHCHNINNHIAVFFSRGRCESCGKMANCYDCHEHTCLPPKPPQKPKPLSS